ncbi:MAG: formyltetrahydrofolate deformylase [Bacillota bacterium]|uniref:formyltetrahydrofolate deformylase n=1 Tax=Virgibacillus TaxID=84406 RepID=UPI0013CEC205|nr:formyltetrahydrofolate deformylase [Virgibacillus sp. Bac332]
MNTKHYRIKLKGEFNFSMIDEVFEVIKLPFIRIHSVNKYQLEGEENLFFLRIELQCKADMRIKYIEESLLRIGNNYASDISMEEVTKKNMAIFVSKDNHCLREILWRWSDGELSCNIPLVISDYDTHKELVESYGIPFLKLRLTKTNEKNDSIASSILMENNIDFIVLARYMQVLSPRFVRKFDKKIINIHHSLLPAFIGANTYRRAFERGVKVIGATAHYVTEKLDEGPILAQQAIHLTDGLTLSDYKQYGKSIESDTLLQAIKWHIEDKIFIYHNKALVLK